MAKFQQYDRIKYMDFGTGRKVGCQVKEDLGNGKIIAYHPASFDSDGYEAPDTKFDEIEILEIDIKEDEVVRI